MAMLAVAMLNWGRGRELLAATGSRKREHATLIVSGDKALGAFVALLLLATLPGPAWATDRVRLTAGNTANGTITEMSANEVTVELGSNKRTFPVNEIESVQFDSEPNPLTQGRVAVNAGRYSDALTILAKLDDEDLKRVEMAKDVEFFKALCAARLALAGEGSIADAGKKMSAFEKSSGTNYHYYAACETLGNLLLALHKPADAERYYSKLADAPWPDFKLRAGVLLGQALATQKQFGKAAAKFEEVLAMKATGKEADAFKATALLGKAGAFSALGKADEAGKLIDEIIAKAEPEDSELHAKAYNIQGNSLKAAGKKKEALLAFLRVDLLYPRHPEQHAEALANLATLWTELDKPERAAQALSTLKEKYPSSPWATK